MLDLKFVRENPEVVKENIKKKFKEDRLPIVDEVYVLDQQFRNAKKEADDLRSEKNNLSSQIGSLMREKKEDEAMSLRVKIGEMSDRIKELEEENKSLKEKLSQQDNENKEANKKQNIKSIYADIKKIYMEFQEIIIQLEESKEIVFKNKFIESAEKEFAGASYADFKQKVGEAVVEYLKPIQEKYRYYMNNKDYLNDIMKKGAETAGYMANKTLSKVYRKVGFVQV